MRNAMQVIRSKSNSLYRPLSQLRPTDLSLRSSNSIRTFQTTFKNLDADPIKSTNSSDNLKQDITSPKRGIKTRVKQILLVFGVLMGGTVYWFLIHDSDLKEVDPIVIEQQQSESRAHTKPRVVILGSGWGALSLLQDIDTNLYEVIVISPRNYFLFTPLLPSVVVSTLDAKSITEPIRKFCSRNNIPTQYFEASCVDVDFSKKVVKCVESATKTEPVQNGPPPKTFDVTYDHLVIAVGSVNNTFGTPGVYEYCNFLKEMEDAVVMKKKILDCFEKANLPTTPEDEKKKLLSFVVVGGGPNGVEVAAELNDYIREDLKRYYPHLMPYVKITLLELLDHVLNFFDARVSEYTEKRFRRDNIDVKTNHHVTSINKDSVVVKQVGKEAPKDAKPYNIPYGLCCWSTGIGAHPLVNTIRDKLPSTQQNRRALVTDRYLMLNGTNNVYAIGDCATINQDRILDKMVDIFRESDRNGDGFLSLEEFQDMVKRKQSIYPQLEEYYHKAEELFAEVDVQKKGQISLDQFKQILTKVDTKLKLLPATAQVARQEGSYLANRLNKMAKQEHFDQPFRYSHFGSFVYIGSDDAVLEFANKYILSGFGAYLGWRSVYYAKQFSNRNKTLVLTDWCKTKVYGRNVTRN